MKFEDVSLDGAVGAILAHAHRVGGRAMLKKGHVVTADDVVALRAAGILYVATARLDAGDVGEDDAARRVATAITGSELTIGRATTGRANIFAAARGVLVIDRDRIDALNAIDEAITVATVPPYAVVEAGAMAATVKIIPFAVPEELVARACDVAGSLLTLAPFSKKRAGLVLTEIPGVHEGQGGKAAENQRRRMAYLGGELVRVTSVRHDASFVADALESMLAEGLDLLLVLGASAIVDRKDVVPTAIEAIGGHVEHVGMPVDPGNMLLVGRKGLTPIIGVPGCARSLKPSGFDWVLERLAANLPVTRADITRLGVGGLLSEIVTRPSPRQPGAPKTAAPRVAAIVLAAGLARRMGGVNKLTAPIDGTPIVARVVDALLASKVTEVLVVVGHRADDVRAALEGRAVRFVENEAYEEGLGASLRAGVEALGEAGALDGAFVALGDMPWVRENHIDAIIAAFDPTGPHSICVPVHDRKRGHPVLWSKRHFAEMKKLGGDVGARALLEAHADAVLAVPVDDPAVHIDVDTPEMLADAAARKG